MLQAPATGLKRSPVPDTGPAAGRRLESARRRDNALITGHSAAEAPVTGSLAGAALLVLALLGELHVQPQPAAAGLKAPRALTALPAEAPPAPANAPDALCSRGGTIDNDHTSCEMHAGIW